jgi:hypothetical protein
MLYSLSPVRYHTIADPEALDGYHLTAIPVFRATERFFRTIPYDQGLFRKAHRVRIVWRSFLPTKSYSIYPPLKFEKRLV